MLTLQGPGSGAITPGPAGYVMLIAQPGPNQGTRSRHCPG